MSVRVGFYQKLREAVSLEKPYLQRPVAIPSRQGRAAAVLALWGHATGADDPQILLTRRTDLVEKHKGQIAFPGGVTDPEDLELQGSVTTALREADEEVGLSADSVEVIGKLPDLWTPTGFWVTPIVGILREPLESLVFRPNPAEIAEIFWAPMSVLRHPQTYQLEYLEHGGVRYPIHVYQVAGHRVWGATGAMIKNMLDRLDILG